jgi:hypothetical protein
VHVVGKMNDAVLINPAKKIRRQYIRIHKDCTGKQPCGI